MGWALLAVFQHAPIYVLALSAGFLLMGPFMCMGLYRVSQQLERGDAPHFIDSLLAWRTRMGTLAIFGFALLVLEMLWGRAALVVFAVSFDGMPDFKGSVLKVLAFEHLGFVVAYLGVGAVFAGLIYAVSVVAIPMILDRQTDAITAALTSLRLFFTQTFVLLCWGALITGLVVLALLPWFLGLLVVGPVLGHATWHAYRAAVGELPSGRRATCLTHCPCRSSQYTTLPTTAMLPDTTALATATTPKPTSRATQPSLLQPPKSPICCTSSTICRCRSWQSSS